MTLYVNILVVGQDSNQPYEQIDKLIHGTDCIGGEFSYEFMKCDKEKIKNKLISLSLKTENYIIILIGDTTVSPSLSDVAYEAIKEVIDKCVPDDVNALISELTEKLKYAFDRSICGIRNNKLIINMCGAFVNAMINLKANENLIFEIMFLINRKTYIPNKQIKDNPGEGPSNINDNNSDITNRDYISKKEIQMKIWEAIYKKQKETASDGTDNSDKKFDKNDNNSDETFPDCISEEEMKNIAKEIYKKQEEYEMISISDAEDIICEVIIAEHSFYIEQVRTKNAYGRIMAENVISPVDVPSYRSSAKRGYAVLASDRTGVRKVLKVHSEVSIVPGICMRVRSGDPIPNGATAVVTSKNVKILKKYNEDCFNIADEEFEIEILVAPKENENIRIPGCEIELNQIIINKYSCIGTAAMNILTLCGIESVQVIKIPSVGLLSIGNELEESGNTLTLGRVYDCNRITVRSILKKAGYDPMDFGISAYKLNVMIKKIKDALDEIDILVIMGRASDKDILKPILTSYFCADIHFGCVNMKPGKSTTFASCIFNGRRKFFLCMSANPATVPIVTHVILLPLLHEMTCNIDSIHVDTMNALIMTPQELHSRPKFSWTFLKWMETDETLHTHPTAYSLTVPHYNMIKYQGANALLKLPSRTLEMSKLDAKFVSAKKFFG